MVSLEELTSAMALTLGAIPPLAALLVDQGVVPYIDLNPTRNSMSKAIYEMPAGSLLLVWNGTTLDTFASSMEGWMHIIQIFIKAKRGGSAYDIIDALVNGIPVPGDGLIWRYCPLIDGVLPTNVREIVRLIDEEGIDYIVVTTATQETGDAVPAA